MREACSKSQYANHPVCAERRAMDADREAKEKARMNGL
jgi:hypothetical protein